MTSGTGPTRKASARRVGRRPPEVARQEILDATAFLLSQRPFRELSVADIMNRTQIGRSAFYVYFKDIYAVVEALLVAIRDEELAFLDSWSSQQVESRDALQQIISNTVNLWVVRGPMISAMLDAAASDPRLEAIFIGITEAYCKVVATSLQHEQAAGRIRPMDCEEMASLLVIGTQAYLKTKLGHANRRDPLKVAATLLDTWTQAIFGRTPE